MLRYALYHPTRHVPPLLHFGRLRALRHWTIHRAWQLYQSNVRAAQQLELERQYSSIRAAMEELRTSAGDGGRLYRQALSKKGTWGGRSDLSNEGEAGEGGRVERGREGGVPIEYARGQTDGPPRGGWDYEWRR